jgi:hypothetical protein
MPYEFDHVAQQVPDIAEAVGWYRDHIPGTQVLYEDATWGFIEAGGAKIAFVRRDEHPGHLAWRVPADELDRLAEAHGATVKMHRDRTKSFYLQAPGGEFVEFISVEGTKWEELASRADATGSSSDAV